MVDSPIMRNEDLPGTPSEEPLRVKDVLRIIFKHAGITFETASFLRWRVIDDRIIPLPIDTLEALAEGLGDGGYQLAITGAVISQVGKAPIEIPWIHIEISYTDGTWSAPRIYADEETIRQSEEEPQILFARLQKIKEILTPVFEMISMFARVAKAIGELFS